MGLAKKTLNSIYALPDVTYTNGIKTHEDWIVDGKYHRTDGPARIEWFDDDGSLSIEEWLVEGKPHRLDGPAYILHPEQHTIEYWIYGIEFDECKYEDAVKMYNSSKLAFVLKYKGI